jgi:isoleucyl-tRNA synthetase
MKQYILAKSRLAQLYPIMNNKKKWKPGMAAETYEIKATLVVTYLVGKRYQSFFDFFANTPKSGNYFQVLSDTYVTDDAGTGFVHQAPAFGEDDHLVCLAHQVILRARISHVLWIPIEC